MKRFIKVFGALAAAILAAGCANNCRTDCPDTEAARQEGMRQISQVGCSKGCGKSRCRGDCHHQPPAPPPPPVVITEPCHSTGAVDPTSLVLNATARIRVTQTTVGQLVVSDCEGKECAVAEGSKVTTTTQELPITAVVNTGGTVTIKAEPGKKPCDEPKPEQKPEQK